MLKQYEEQFQVIMDTKVEDKDLRLAKLMTDMEKKFNIPMLKNEDWITNNLEAYRLYRKVSDSRSIWSD
ncbi:hypothetical protein D5E69_22650 (plasmid) [Rossellomorea marisflavi]|jgi:hypothetical protein|uniref:hypothetical protein n=1 Tax=Rossellomorea marisflavi TaxID=189381 RepID=UPI00131950C0|nr:hypothetical protein [Rossellomorea marisflavi]QHA38645.1 hypothetical protein D5E69_22650 [Rossellomorea marisflavi]